MSKGPRIEFRVSEEERQRLDLEAVAHQCSRPELIRKRVFAKEAPAEAPQQLRGGRDAIDRAITAVTRQYSGIPRHHLEPIVCTVICALAADG